MLSNTKKRKRLIWVIGIVYAVVILYFLFLRNRFDIGGSYWEHLAMNINVVPLNTIKQMVYLIVYGSNPYLIPYAVINLLGNIAGFVPLGLLLPVTWEKLRTFKKTFFCAALSILLVEVIQLFTLRGSFDIDDLFLNLIGVAVGFLLRKVVLHENKNTR